MARLGDRCQQLEQAGIRCALGVAAARSAPRRQAARSRARARGRLRPRISARAACGARPHAGRSDRRRGRIPRRPAGPAGARGRTRGLHGRPRSRARLHSCRRRCVPHSSSGTCTRGRGAARRRVPRGMRRARRTQSTAFVVPRQPILWLSPARRTSLGSPTARHRATRSRGTTNRRDATDAGRRARQLREHEVHDGLRKLVVAAGDPHLRARQPVAAVVLRPRLAADVCERGAGVRLREAHRPDKAAFKHRPHEAPALAGVAEADEEVRCARRQRGVRMESDIGARKHCGAGLCKDERAVAARRRLDVECGRRERGSL